MEFKIASKDDLINLYRQKMEDDSSNIYLKENLAKRIDALEKKTRMFFVGIEKNEYICEMAACVSPDDEYTQNIQYVTDKDTFYLFSFFTKEGYRGKGYFSQLFRFAKDVLIEMGAKHLTLGVEPDDSENKERYRNYGFDELIYKGWEEFDGMKIEVEYYRKKLD